MPTSSIFQNFTITGEKEAEQFFDALEKAEAQPPWDTKINYDPLITDPEVTRALMAKREKLSDSSKR